MNATVLSTVNHNVHAWRTYVYNGKALHGNWLETVMLTYTCWHQAKCYVNMAAYTLQSVWNLI